LGIFGEGLDGPVSLRLDLHRQKRTSVVLYSHSHIGIDERTGDLKWSRLVDLDDLVCFLVVRGSCCDLQQVFVRHAGCDKIQLRRGRLIEWSPRLSSF
jgi:hypothetical protein